MAYKHSIRKTTQRQFSDGCTIDGLDLDVGLEESLARHAAPKRGDVGSRFVRQVRVMGWEPPLDDGAAVLEDRPATKIPFLNLRNCAGNTYSTTPYDYATLGESEWRNKGCDQVGRPQDGVPIRSQWVWTTSFPLVEPEIVQDITFLLLRDGKYTNTFVHSGPLLSPATQVDPGVPDYASDWVVQLQVEAQEGRNHAELSELAANCWSWRADAVHFVAAVPAAVDFYPNTIIGSPAGLAIRLRELNVPLPSYSWMRLSLILPSHDPTVWSSCWGASPWKLQVYHVSLTTLQEIRA